MPKILIVEDDKDISSIEKDYLELNNFTVEIIADGGQVIDAINSQKFDLIILDLMLPNINGFDLCKELRTIVDIPIIMVTAKNETIDKIKGLGLGSNDYMTKPFDPNELIARVKSQLHNYELLKGTNNEIVIGNLKIISKNYRVYKNNQEIKLPNKEFELLDYLAHNPNIVFSKEQLFERIWGLDSDGEDATITVHINRIREKIEDNPSQPKIIETVWGAGYRLNK